MLELLSFLSSLGLSYSVTYSVPTQQAPNKFFYLLLTFIRVVFYSLKLKKLDWMLWDDFLVFLLLLIARGLPEHATLRGFSHAPRVLCSFISSARASCELSACTYSYLTAPLLWDCSQNPK